MRMKNSSFYFVASCILTFSFCLVLSTSAQNLTVPQIMAEPSIAGMRVEGEKLSPHGKSVIFFWKGEGKLPRDPDIAPTHRSDPKTILHVSDRANPTAMPTP